LIQMYFHELHRIIFDRKSGQKKCKLEKNDVKKYKVDIYWYFVHAKESFRNSESESNKFEIWAFEILSLKLL